MRVGILTTELIANGGAARQALMLAQSLETLGHRASVYAMEYCAENCYPEIARSIDIRAVERISAAEVEARARERHHNLLRGVRRHLVASSQLARLVDEPCDILNPHVRGATRAAVMCKRRTGTPVVWMCEDARNWEEPGYRPYYSKPVQFVFDHAMAQAERRVVREIDRIVTLDHRVKGIVERFYGRPAEVVRSGVDVKRFRRNVAAREQIRERHGIASGDFLLLWLGILEPHRRLEDAIEAIRLLHLSGETRFRLLIAGSAAIAPGYAKELQELAAKYGLGEAVQFHLEAVPEGEMADYYSAGDALIYLAENQCWGLGIFEALACELPVIVSRSCGAHEVLEDRRTAMLVGPRSPQDVARALIELAVMPRRGASQAREARAEVLERFTWEAYARNLLQVFDGVLCGHGKAATQTHREAFA
ncbi:MAG TPA: glycosyltransferase family 4 protein [Candidatus Limnocylindrales bacterium]|nr:glycosyltransferase family 4 protein [Candidatus Limnocylindrales bacterium]